MRRINRTLTAKLWIWATQECKKVGLECPSSTPEYRVYAAPGRSTQINLQDPMFLRYEPDETHLEVCIALERLEPLPYQLIRAKYAEGKSEEVLTKEYNAWQMIYGDGDRTTFGKLRWQMEKAYKSVAKELNIPVYT